MKTPNWQPVQLTQKDGFKLVLSFEEEYSCGYDHFVNECDWSKEDYESIKNFYWFCAKVTAFKGKIECGTKYLGACCHKSKKDVIETDLGGYLPQMIEQAIDEAKQNLEIK